MTYAPSRFRALAFVMTAGFGLAQFAPQTHLGGILTTAAAQTVEAAPTAAPGKSDESLAAPPEQKLAADMVNGSVKSRHLAPHGTFFLLDYVAVRTGSGVEGFDPGQEVHLVEVHRETHTLVVTDGHAQVELTPDKLTNDVDIAALVRQKDEASQTQIAAHVQAERAAYAKFEREAADATAKDLADRRQNQKAQEDELRREEQTPVAQTAQPTPAAPGADGYYGYGGDGYGNPYSYFSGPSVVVVPGRSGTVPAGRADAPSTASRVNPASVGTAGVARPIH